MFEIHVRHKKAKSKLKTKGFDMDKLNTGIGDYQDLDKAIKQREPKVKNTEFDFVNDMLVVKYPSDAIINPSLFVEYGDVEVVVIDA